MNCIPFLLSAPGEYVELIKNTFNLKNNFRNGSITKYFMSLCS